jgi:uncharacterized Zn finger protein (UPF0148 family)
MMLGGWKMLATHCPICNSALLQKELKVQCASCNMPVMTEEQYSARPASDQSAKTVSIANPAVSVMDSQTALGTADSVSQNSKNILSSKTEAAAAAAAAAAATATTTVIDVPNSTHSTYNKALSLSESIANTRKLQENQETFFSVDNFDGYYSDNDNIGVTNTLEAEKKEYDRKNKQRDVISVKLGEEGLCKYVQAFMCVCLYSFKSPLRSPYN